MDNTIRTFFLLLGAGAIAAMSFLPGDWPKFLNDYGSPRFPYPFTINNAMWIIFFYGLGEAATRWRSLRREKVHLRANYLEHPTPDAPFTLSDLPMLQQRVEENRKNFGDGFLPRLLEGVIRALRISRSVGNASTILSTNLDLYYNIVTSRYTRLEYICWLIPTIGFIGTVVGIAFALDYAGGVDVTNPDLLKDLSAQLGTAFYTTFIALIQAAILVACKTFFQNAEEVFLNQSAQHCVEELINSVDVPS